MSLGYMSAKPAIVWHNNSTIPAYPWDEYQQVETALLNAQSTEWNRTPGGIHLWDFVAQAKSNAWVYALRVHERREVHPAVEYLLRKGYRPDSMIRLALACPYVAVTDPTMLAFVENERKGRANRQTMTSPGKFLRRHFPQLADHEIRDAAALGAADLKFELLGENPDGTPEPDARSIIRALERGPQSCMHHNSDYSHHRFTKWIQDSGDNEALFYKWLAAPRSALDDDEFNDVPWQEHPYAVYLPSLGWRMAVGSRPGEDGYFCRALVNVAKPDHKHFVRSYMRGDDAHNTQVSDALDTWMRAQNIVKANYWRGRIAKIDVGNYDTEWLLPYIDGSWQGVLTAGDAYGVFVICDDGHSACEYRCDNTDGTGEECDQYDCYCSDCGAGIRYDDGDYYGIGRHGDDGTVCSDCISEYTSVQGRGGDEYYVPDEDAVAIVDDCGHGTGDYVDSSNPPSDYVRVGDGRYCHIDDVVMCTDGEYHPCAAYNVVELARECPDTGERYALKIDAFKHDGKWYSDADDVSDLEEDDEAEDADEDADDSATPKDITVPDEVRTQSVYMQMLWYLDRSAWQWIMENGALISTITEIRASGGDERMTIATKARRYPLHRIMLWESTPQGHIYWANLNEQIMTAVGATYPFGSASSSHKLPEHVSSAIQGLIAAA